MYMICNAVTPHSQCSLRACKDAGPTNYNHAAIKHFFELVDEQI